MTTPSANSPRYEPLRKQHFFGEIEPEDGNEDVLTSARLSCSPQHPGDCKDHEAGAMCNYLLVFMFMISSVLGVTAIFILLHGHILQVQPNNVIEASNSQHHTQSTEHGPGRLDFGADGPAIQQQFPCGRTPGEAKTAGCLFDIMTASWIPPKCFDEGITEEFRQHGPWEFYTTTRDFSMNQTVRWPRPEQLVLLPDEETVGKAGLVWGTRRYHLTHCIFLLRRLHRAVDGGTKLASDIWLYHHSEHCGDMIEKSMNLYGRGGGIPLDEVMTLTIIGYPDC